MTGILNVSGEKLLATASEFSTQGNTISGLTSEMVSLVESLASSWEGDAATAYISKFKSLDSDIQLLNRMIQEHVNDLQQMESVYSAAEQQSVEDASSLSANILS